MDSVWILGSFLLVSVLLVSFKSLAAAVAATAVDACCQLNLQINFFLRYWCLSNRWEEPLPQRPLKLKKHHALRNRGRNFAKNHDFVPVSINSFDFKQEFY